MDLKKYRKDFPSLNQKRNNKPPVYFDNACMTLKPVQVIEAMNEYYYKYPACGERSLHWFARRVNEGVGRARESIRKLINAKHVEEIIFTKNATEAINMIAQSIKWNPDDVVVTTDKEHNSNLCPWQELQKRGVIKKHTVVPSNPDNTFSIENLKRVVSKEGKSIRLFAFPQISNLDGAEINEKTIKEIVSIVKKNNPNAFVLVDGAQSVPHKKVDVKELGVDFLAFSVHKMVGPTGVGVLYGKKEILENEDVMSPFIVGGGTVEDAHLFEHPKYFKPPLKYEAGLQNYAGIIGAGAAAEYLLSVGLSNIERHEKELQMYISQKLESFPEIEIIGPPSEKRTGIITFFIKKPVTRLSDDEPDIDEKLNEYSNIMIRKGTFCVHSWYHAHEDYFDSIWPGFRPTLYRVSLYLYNTKEEAEIFIKTLRKILDELKEVPILGE